MISQHYISIIVSPTLLTIPALALAQSEAALDGGGRIVVTATRGETEEESVAARTEVITRDEIELKGYVTVVDALRRVPGLDVVQGGGAGALTSVFARGTNSKHTLALYDGIRLNDPSSPNGQYNFGSDTLGDLDRVEVLRGPASAVYGSDAIGGAVNFIPRVGADRAFAPYAEVAGGNLDTWRGLAGARGSAGRLDYGLTAEYFETGGFNNTATRIADDLGERDGSRFLTLTGNAELGLAEGFSLRGLARYRRARAEFDDAALDREGRGGKDRYFVWRIAPRVSALGGRYRGDLELGQVDNRRSEWDDPDANNPSGGPDSQASGLRSFLAWRNRLQVYPASHVTAVLSAGFEWQRERIAVSGGFNDPLARSEEQTAVYGLAQLGIADRVNLNGSLRHDDPEAFEAATTWNAGAVLHLPEIGGRAYVAYGTSFKAPTLSERFATSAFNVGNPDLVPERGKSFEAGLDVGIAVGGNGWLGAKATYFDTRIHDLIEYDFAALANRNIGKAAIDGYELSLVASAEGAAQLQVSYTRTDARDDITGERLLRRPKHGWSASLTLTPMKRLALSADYFRRGERRDVIYADTNEFGPGGGYLGNGMVEAYDLAGLAVRYDLTRTIQLFGNVSNAFDEEYEEPDSYRGAPRSWQVGARARF